MTAMLATHTARLTNGEQRVVVQHSDGEAWLTPQEARALFVSLVQALADLRGTETTGGDKRHTSGLAQPAQNQRESRDDGLSANSDKG